MTSHIEKVFGTNLTGTYLRIEFAQDIDGFWLEPHTDLGVKVFTMLLYLSKGPRSRRSRHRHLRRQQEAASAARLSSPMRPWCSCRRTIPIHGFEKRPIKGVRTSLIINYVTNEWRAREQLAFPETPIA